MGPLRLLIVDDDRMICAGTVRRISNMHFPEIEVIDCAYSGEEALSVLRERRVDAMFTDIRMGEMDGLALIGAAKALQPVLICVVITAFDQFQYAQQAIRLGVEDYLVKPVSVETMRRQVQVVIDKHAGMAAARESRLELDIRAQMLSGERDVDACFEDCGYPKPEWPMCVVRWHSAADDARWMGFDEPWTIQPRGHAFLVTPWKGPETRRRIETEAARLERFAGVSLPGRNLKALAVQAEEALDFCWLASAPGAVFWEPQQSLPASASDRELFDELRRLNAQGVAQRLLRRLENLSQGRARAAGALVRRLIGELQVMASSRDIPSGGPLELRPGLGAHGAAVMIAEEIEHIRRAGESAEALSASAFAMRYAREHLYEPVDMAVVANALNMNYAYFSRVFREQTGDTFSRYLIKLRMEEVCRLLLAGEKLVDIAEKFGYQNAANLTRSFTREMGVPPSKWLSDHARHD